ncbi:peptidase S11 [Alicyclobacillus ferrooxydans]|uniref:Peptidase S11 n=2 Tax=Alicyclobacillus ferrooxydans TaxID=471514 RepID=A0A0P9GP50_9BACL|nr:peptidase S11 [Alicyclobacillus ferrooxydans]
MKLLHFVSLFMQRARLKLLFLGVTMLAVPVASTAPVYASDRVFLNAKSAIVMDADTHQVIYAKNPDLQLYPASTTKLMTAILLVTHLNPKDPVYISKEAASQPRVRLGLKSGTTITADDALRAVIMKSANDVAYAVAETVGGSQQGFARMMNLKARLLGCTHTNFVTPNGLHDDAHKTTSRDVALILAEAVKYPRIVAAMQTKDYSIAGKPFHNGNRMLYVTNTTYGQTIGGKTGYTSKAMYCLAFAVKQHGHTRVSVVLGAPRKSFMYRETRRLLDWSYRDKAVQLV